MRVFEHQDIEAVADWRDLIEHLRQEFANATIEAPDRWVLDIDAGDGERASLLIMPAWQAGKAIGIKAVTFFPGNAKRGMATINAGMMLFDGANGRFEAALDGDTITEKRTAATSALAADYLAHKGAERLLVVGTGQLAKAVAAAHSTVRNYKEILVWGRSSDKAQRVADALRENGYCANPCDDLEAGCRSADVITCVTASTTPLVKGAWLKNTAHLDLIGAFKPDMREADTQAITGAQVFVDAQAGATLAGDLAQPIAEGAFSQEDIAANLTELAQGSHPGRVDNTGRTVFKSAGLSLEDLSAAMFVAANSK